MISLILATHNGAATLPRTLSSLSRIVHPSQGLEIITVDNASTDQTRQILESYLNSLPLTILGEPRQGKSFALNTGIDHAKGDFIVFTDDDVIPEVNWLTAYLDAAERHADVGIFAGQVRHKWEAQPPPWLTYLADIGKSFGGTPVGLEEQKISPGAIKGCNLMVRRSTLAHTRFSEQAGVNFSVETPASGGEDTLFAREIAKRANGILFVPEACVRHIVRANQVGVRPVFSRYFRIGGTCPIEAKGGITIVGYPAWGLRQASTEAAQCFLWLMRGNSERAALGMTHLAKTLGGLSKGRKIRSTKNSIT